jgi:hypothetical protein
MSPTQLSAKNFIALVRSLERLTFATAVRVQKEAGSDETPRSDWWVTGALNLAVPEGLSDDCTKLLLSIEDHHRICKDTWSMVTKAQFDATKEAIFKGLEERFSIESGE